jgi:hypothetical protein
MARIVLLPTPTPDGRRIVLRAEVRTPRDRLRRLAEALARRLRPA